MSASVLQFAPRVGRAWHGGVFAGVIGAYKLIAGPVLDTTADWASATAWAARLQAWGHADFELPRVGELLLLAEVFPKLFEGSTLWWGCETHPELESHALVLHSGQGHYGPKHCRCHAIAVRRVLDVEPQRPAA